MRNTREKHALAHLSQFIEGNHRNPSVKRICAYIAKHFRTPINKQTTQNEGLRVKYYKETADMLSDYLNAMVPSQKIAPFFGELKLRVADIFKIDVQKNAIEKPRGRWTNPQNFAAFLSCLSGWNEMYPSDIYPRKANYDRT